MTIGGFMNFAVKLNNLNRYLLNLNNVIKMIFLVVVFFISSSFLLAQAPMDRLITDNLISYYPFNGDFNDHSDFLRTSAVYGVQLSTDRFGNNNNAAYFDGNSYINTNWTPGQMNEISMSVWIKATSINWDNMIISSGRDTGSPYGGFHMHVYNNYDFNGYVDTSNPGARFAGHGPISLNTWYHGVYTYNGSNAKFYLNGELVANEIWDISMPVLSSPDVLLIGMMGAGWNWYKWNGWIDDVSLFDRETSVHQALTLSNEPNPLFQPITIISSTSPLVIPFNSTNFDISLNDFFSGSNISYSFTGNTMISATVLDGNILSLEPAPDWTGTEYITIRATNNLGYVEQVLRVTVVQTLETSEDFDNEGNLPPGWSVSHYGSTDFPWQANLDEGDDYNIQVMVNTGKTANERLLSPNYDLSNFQNITVSFDSNFLPYSNGQGSFAYTLNNITYTVVETYTSPHNEMKSYLLPGLTGKSNVKFRWIYGNNTVNTGQENYWDIDDFNIYGDFLDNDPPNLVNGLSLISQTSHSATLSWEESSEPYFERYELYLSQDGTVDIDDQLWSVEQDSSLFYITTTETTITDLDNGDYWIAIRAIDQSNNSSNLSDPISIHIDNESPILSSPIPQLQPEPVWQNSRTVQIGCSINDLSSIDISSMNYRIDYNGNGIYDDTELWLLIPDSTRIIHERDEVNLSFEVTFDSDGILPFEFKASDIYGNIAYSGVNSQAGVDDDWVVRISTLPPAEITTFFVQEVADSTVQLAWETVANISLLGYRIHYSTLSDVNTSDSYWDWNNDSNMSNPSSEFISTTISELNPGTRYYFLLLALDGIGGSFEYPDIITAMTSSSAPPETPDNLTVEISEGLIILDWDDVIVDIFGNNIVISYYEVYVGDYPEFECNFNSLIGTVNESYLELPDVVQYADKLFFKIRANSGMIRRTRYINKSPINSNNK